MADFAKLLNVKAGTIEKPKPIAPGTYVATITKYELGESRQNKTPYCRFHFRPDEALEDVDQELLAAAGGIEAAKKRPLRNDFWLTEDAMYRLNEFLADVVGIDNSDGERTLQEMIPEAVNVQVRIAVTHNIVNNEPRAQISDFAKHE